MTLIQHDIPRIDPKDPDAIRKMLNAHRQLIEALNGNYRAIDSMEARREREKGNVVVVGGGGTSSSGGVVTAQTMGDSGTIPVVGAATDAIVPLNRIAPNTLYEIHMYLITTEGYGSVIPKIPPFAADSRALDQFLYDRDQTGMLKWFVFYKV